VSFKVPTSEERKISAQSKLEDQKLSAGNKRLLNMIDQAPGQLERDINRLGTLVFGEREFSNDVYANQPYEQIYRWASNQITEYISKENPDLKMEDQRGGIDGLLCSTPQIIMGDLVTTAPTKEYIMYPWAPPEKGAWANSTTKFEFEKSESGKPEVLIVTRRQEKNHVNHDDPKAAEKTIILEHQVKHNLVTGEVSFVYKHKVLEKSSSPLSFLLPEKVVLDDTWNPDAKVEPQQ
jgi:hypothetical protein